MCHCSGTMFKSWSSRKDEHELQWGTYFRHCMWIYMSWWMDIQWICSSDMWCHRTLVWDAAYLWRWWIDRWWLPRGVGCQRGVILLKKLTVHYVKIRMVGYKGWIERKQKMMHVSRTGRMFCSYLPPQFPLQYPPSTPSVIMIYFHGPPFRPLPLPS